MRFAESTVDGGHHIRAYGPEGILIGARTYRCGLVITPGRLIPDWGPATAADLKVEHLQILIELAPEVIILGTGSMPLSPDLPIYQTVLAQRIGFEVMGTGAACRTYNILMAEGRRIAAGLLPL